MKEIKFRAWNKKNKKMQYSGIVWGITNLNYPALTGLNDFGDIDNLSDLMQYIGLKDKNGKEIYENDIINGGSYNGVYCYGKVIYWKDMFCLEPIGNFKEGICEIYINLSHLEIIGNIYKTPELLK